MVLHRHVRIVFLSTNCNSNFLGKFAIRDTSEIVATKKLLLVDLAKIQYACDNEGSHFCINIDYIDNKGLLTEREVCTVKYQTEVI